MEVLFQSRKRGTQRHRVDRAHIEDKGVRANSCRRVPDLAFWQDEKAARRRRGSKIHSRQILRWRNERTTEGWQRGGRSEEHTSELQSHVNLVCRLLLEKKKTQGSAADCYILRILNTAFGIVFTHP